MATLTLRTPFQHQTRGSQRHHGSSHRNPDRMSAGTGEDHIARVQEPAIDCSDRLEYHFFHQAWSVLRGAMHMTNSNDRGDTQ